MKRYAVLSIWASDGHLYDVELDGAFEKFEDAVDCYSQNDSTTIIDCKNGVSFDNGDKEVIEILAVRYPSQYSKDGDDE